MFKELISLAPAVTRSEFEAMHSPPASDAASSHRFFEHILARPRGGQVLEGLLAGRGIATRSSESTLGASR